MKFGIRVRKQLTGADLYVRIFQISALLPILYMLTASGYMGIFAKKGFLSTMFSIGVSALPRAEALALSLLYRLTASEVAVYFVLLGAALGFGILAGKLLRGPYETARTARKVFAALIGLDLLIRLIPLRFNLAFGLPLAILAFAIRLACLILIAMDLKADSKQ